MSDAFGSLHPVLQHHIVNSLGWRTLRPLQEATIAPLQAGEHALLLAPTAGGKTEAAAFPVLSRMMRDEWRGLSVLYLCPIKALLNNLHFRLSQYAAWIGRTVALWHGDVADGEKQDIRRSPPDVLLTTPESLEVLLTSKRSDPRAMFAGVQVVVVDELHAFAGDDRGWHLLSVVARVAKLAGRPIQRIGLSATVGNPDALLQWFAGHVEGARRVIAPPAGAAAQPEVRLDHVASLDNAATVISRLHRGEKRLVFVDSRSRVEKLAAGLRGLGVNTFVSHSSVSLDERKRAEEAFAQGTDCVIVATSTLELGIDVGDLDRVIQLDAPGSVASFLQRIGRTGRRPGTTRNCLFLTTDDDGFLRAAGLLDLWARGYVEPIVPSPSPYHLFAQQIMALALQTGGLGRLDWQAWIGAVPCFAAMGPATDQILDHMLAHGVLAEDQGRLWFGTEGQRTFGYKNFLELYSIFTSPPLFTVLHGRSDLGLVHETSFAGHGKNGAAVLLLGGRSWAVKSLDWSRRVAYVEPAPAGGASRWCGGSRTIHLEHARAMRRVLATGHLAGLPSKRAVETLAALRDEFSWVEDGSTAIVSKGGESQWWTFAGLRANATLAARLGNLVASPTVQDNLALPLRAGVDREAIERQVSSHPVWSAPVSAQAQAELKFVECLPEALAGQMMVHRAADERGAEASLAERIRDVVLG
ncbi:MAG: DEAD/DEAH box helicase [Planctomycetota bacterium]